MYRVVFNIQKSNEEIFITIEYIFILHSFVQFYRSHSLSYSKFFFVCSFHMFLQMCSGVSGCCLLLFPLYALHHSIGSITSWNCILTIPMFVESKFKYHAYGYTIRVIVQEFPCHHATWFIYVNWIGFGRRCIAWRVVYGTHVHLCPLLLRLWKTCLAPYRIAIARKNLLFMVYTVSPICPSVFAAFASAQAFNISNLMESILLVICIRFCIRPVFSSECSDGVHTVLKQHCKNRKYEMLRISKQRTLVY